jgi:hypothetical protein
MPRILSIFGVIVALIAFLLTAFAGVTIVQWATSYPTMMESARSNSKALFDKQPDSNLEHIAKDVRGLKNVAGFHTTFSIWLISKSAFSFAALFLALFTWIIALQLQIIALLLTRKKTEQDAAANP